MKYLNEIYFLFHQTALYGAIEENNIEIVKLLLSNEKLNINILNVLYCFINKINMKIIERNSRLYILNMFEMQGLMKFKLECFNRISNFIIKWN